MLTLKVVKVIYIFQPFPSTIVLSLSNLMIFNATCATKFLLLLTHKDTRLSAERMTGTI